MKKTIRSRAGQLLLVFAALVLTGCMPQGVRTVQREPGILNLSCTFPNGKSVINNLSIAIVGGNLTCPKESNFRTGAME